MEPGRIPIPNKLKKYRSLAGYSQKEVAYVLGLKNASPLCRWEKGRSMPSVSQLFQLSLLYKTHPIHLYQDFWQKLKVEIETKASALLGNKPINSNGFSFL